MAELNEHKYMRTVKVFGSHTSTVPADRAQITFAVVHRSRSAKEAVQTVIDKARTILEALRDHEVMNVRSSQASLRKQRQRDSPDEYYEATVGCSVTTAEVNGVADLQLLIVELGADNIYGTSFTTTQLKELRKEARGHAMGAAIEKAKVYCDAAGVQVGSPLRIDDKNPDWMEAGFSGTRHDVYRSQRSPELQALTDDASELPAGTVSVSGALEVEFEVVVPRDRGE